MIRRIADEFYLSMFNNAEMHLRNADHELQETLSKENLVDRILMERRAEEGLSLEESSVLIHLIRNYPDDRLKQKVCDAARLLRKEVFGDRVATMVPIEASSYCASTCKFCGWRADNKEMVRTRISVKAIRKQARSLAEKGISHFEIVGGDDIRFFKTDLVPMIQALKEETRAINPDSRISMCFTAMHEEHYAQFKKEGLDCVLTWQETYNEELYNFHVPAGPKAKGLTRDFRVVRDGNGFLERLKSNESAVRAGLQVGLGAMVGLADNTEADILSVIMHGNKLLNHYSGHIQPIIIGMPAWNAITTGKTDNRFSLGFHFDDFESRFELISAIYLLSFPDYLSWVFANGRVRPEVQINCIKTASCFTSTLVQIAPGGYLDFDVDGNLLEDKESMFVSSSLPLDKLNQETILSGEQFSHFYASHEEFLNMFATRELCVTSDRSFIMEAIAAQRVSEQATL